MAVKMVSGNEAVALAALASGVKVICGYPGTPSTECIDSLIKKGGLPGTHIEWSTNEKVACEIAATASWAGKCALCTMKMSGLNVAYDSLIGISHSGAVGGLVYYVCDDPGVSAGMCEQDSRGFAMMSNMVMLEPASVKESYEMVKQAFALSEAIRQPVFVRSVTAISQSHAPVDIEDRAAPSEEVPHVVRNTQKYAKAGAAMCMSQHYDAIHAMEAGAKWIREAGLHELSLGKQGGLGIVAVGAASAYAAEGMKLAQTLGCDLEGVSYLRAAATTPYPDDELTAILKNCAKLAVVEELEPYLERQLYVLSHSVNKDAAIFGKLNGVLERVGSYHAGHVAKVICAACGVPFDDALLHAGSESAAKSLARPITTCAGCPHRGTYMAINTAIQHAHLKKEDVIVTGDIGCTILGMNPPFDTVWMEISMGASVPCAHGFRFAGVDKPIFATMGDSTFLHGGMPGLVNAIQHDTDMIFIIMDNSWTAMTGMQVNPNTPQQFQYTNDLIHVDIEGIVRGMGVRQLFLMDPYDQEGSVSVLDACMKLTGLRVVIARRECAIQAQRRKIKYARVSIDAAKCVNCKRCIAVTGCSALLPGSRQVSIDTAACIGCGLCGTVCTKAAITKEDM